MTNVLYSSDIHGNEVQYKKLIDYAIETAADVLIIGGDIAPKGASTEEYVKVQRDFFETKFPKYFTRLKRAVPSCTVYLMMGNDDCAVNADVLAYHEPDLYHVIHSRRFQLTGDIDIVGYSCVPITPFGIKDWEKFDLCDVPARMAKRYARRKQTNYNLIGAKSVGEGWMRFEFDPEDEKHDSIQKDLSGEVFVKNPRKTVYVIHTPPDNTNLDLIQSGEHVGSIALRLFIEKYQPYLTLHGHIHETVAVSGNFTDKIGSTHSFASGNHNVGERIAVLSFDLHEPHSVKRLFI